MQRGRSRGQVTVAYKIKVLRGGFGRENFYHDIGITCNPGAYHFKPDFALVYIWENPK